MDDDSYKPTEEERRKFGRISHGYSNSKSFPKFPKSTKSIYDIKKFLRDFGTITTKFKTDVSRKKFLELWYECWRFDNYLEAIKYIREKISRFPKQESELIDSRLKEIERVANAV